jgi:hypothetical protein
VVLVVQVAHRLVQVGVVQVAMVLVLLGWSFLNPLNPCLPTLLTTLLFLYVLVLELALQVQVLELEWVGPVLLVAELALVAVELVVGWACLLRY